MWSWKIEMIKSSLIPTNVCLKHSFNVFHFEKARAAQDEQLFWCIQLKSDLLNWYVAIRECYAWFYIGSIINSSHCHVYTWKQSVLSIKDEQTIISHLEKSEKGTNLHVALKFKIRKQQISDICKNKEKILKFTDSVETSVGFKILVLKASEAHLYHCRKISLPKG